MATMFVDPCQDTATIHALVAIPVLLGVSLISRVTCIPSKVDSLAMHVTYQRCKNKLNALNQIQF